MLSIQDVQYDGDDYALKLPYIKGVASVLPKPRAYIGDKQDSLYGYWRIAANSLDDDRNEVYESIQSLTQGQFQPFEAFEAALDAAARAPDKHLFLRRMRVEILPFEQGFAVRSPYHARIRAMCRSIGGLWNRPSRVWIIQDASDPELFRLRLVQELGLRPSQVTIAPGTYEIVSTGRPSSITGETEEVIKPKPPSTHVPGEVGEPPPKKKPGEEKDEKKKKKRRKKGEKQVRKPKEKFSPYSCLPVMQEHASTGVTKVQAQAAIADYSLREYQKTGVFHLLTQNAALLGDDMGLGKSRQAAVAARIASRGKQILVVSPATVVWNWGDEVAEIAPKDRVAYRRYDSEARWIVCNYERLEVLLPYRDRFAVVIVDEAHNIKEPTAGRTALAFRIAQNIPNRYLLTGTPLLNRHTELMTLLAFSGHPLRHLPPAEFRDKVMSLDHDVLDQLSHWMLRREKKDYLHELPAKSYTRVNTRLTGQNLAEYMALANDRDLLPLQKLNRARQLLERFKTVNYILPWISEMAASDKMIVFCEFKPTVEWLMQRFKDMGVGAVCIHGGISHPRRNEARKRFQTDDNVRVFVGTTGAAGVGINLTAANIVTFASLPWTAGIKLQAEDRAWRSGQVKPVEVRLIEVMDTIDVAVTKLVESKHDMAYSLNAQAAARRAAADSLRWAA